MIKRFFLSIAVLTFAFAFIGCGGSGEGTRSSSAPPGTDTGVPSVVKLSPANFVALANSSITLSAHVLDGNGTALQNITVVFTKVSGTGVLSALSAITNSNGIASVVIASSVAGFSSVMAEVSSGTGLLHDTKTVYFSSVSDIDQLPAMLLDVDGNDNGIYNEPGDFKIFENANDAQVLIRAKLSSLLNLGGTVTFTPDNTTVVTFPDGKSDKFTAALNPDNEAFVLVKFTPSFTSSVVNINATASNGSFNMVSLFLKPVTISSVAVSANPATVLSGGTSTISAFVTTNVGTPVPDGTTVNFTSTAGSLGTPFAQTTDGVAKTTFTAPTVTADTDVTVTASAGGASGITTVKVKPTTPPALAVLPAFAIVDGNVGGKVTFTVSGGTAPYVVEYVCSDLSGVTTVICNSTDADCLDPTDTNVWNTSASFVVTVPPSDLDICSLTVHDFVGDVAFADLQIN